MKTYTVKYKAPNGVFWRKLNKVKGDGFVYTIENGNIFREPLRFFIFEDETRMEIPTSFLFKFSKERFSSIREKVEREAGQKIDL